MSYGRHLKQVQRGKAGTCYRLTSGPMRNQDSALSGRAGEPGFCTAWTTSPRLSGFLRARPDYVDSTLSNSLLGEGGLKG